MQFVFCRYDALRNWLIGVLTVTGGSRLAFIWVSSHLLAKT